MIAASLLLAGGCQAGGLNEVAVPPFARGTARRAALSGSIFAGQRQRVAPQRQTQIVEVLESEC